MRLRFIFNPRSGRPRRNAPILPMLRSYIESGQRDADLVCTEGPGHATELAQEAVAAGYSRIVAVGGDGTVNEVAQALINTQAAMGLVPCGSGNGLALHLGLPRQIRQALELAAASSSRVAAVDTGTVNGLRFVNAMGLGLDSDVAHRFNRLARRGLPAYARTALSAFLKRKTERCFIASGGVREEIDLLLVAIANSDQYGNNAKIAPNARVDDGEFDLVIIRPVGIVSACFLGARLFMGSIDRSGRVIHRRGTRFTIERPAAGIIHTDGESHFTESKIEVAVHPLSLKVIVPADCAVIARSNDRSASGFALQLP